MLGCFLKCNFNKWPVGSPERFIHGCWQLRMMRFHTFFHQCEKAIQDRYNRINHSIGAKAVYIDFLSLGADYRNQSQILNIIQNEEQLTWVWFINCQALLNTSLAGWLRSILTTNNIDHIRVVFILDDQEQYKSIFQRYSAPLYKATTELDTSTN
ncbi:hypothetical protein K1B37_003501 [Vibrio parahaemolyticus]|nr:hypothetical protein [Vibrio parahaemolyticus]